MDVMPNVKEEKPKEERKKKRTKELKGHQQKKIRWVEG